MSFRITYDTLAAYRASISAPLFTEAWDLNLFIIRSGRVGLWDDWVVITCLDDNGRKVVQPIRATGDAWAGEWTDPTHPDGAVWVLPGHYPGGMQRGEHKGRPALRQVKPFDCVRWDPANQWIPTVDELLARAADGHRFSAIRGTHWHNRYNGKAPDIPAPNDSEGCSVSLWQHQHAAGMALVDLQIKYRGSDIVSPTFLQRSALMGG